MFLNKAVESTTVINFERINLKVAPTIVYFNFWKSLIAEVCKICGVSDFLNCNGEVELWSISEK